MRQADAVRVPRIEPWPERQVLIRVAGWAGVVGPALFTATFLALELVRRDDFSPVRSPVSALEAGPLGWVQQLSFVVFGVLTLLFAGGLHLGLRPSRGGAAGPALLGVTGLALLGAAAFPLREDAAGGVYDPGGHSVAGFSFFLTSAVALVVLSRRVARDPAWSPLGAWTLAAGVVCAAGFVVMGTLVIPEGAAWHEWAGLAQRGLILLALFPARVALAVRLVRVSYGAGRAPGRASGDGETKPVR